MFLAAKPPVPKKWRRVPSPGASATNCFSLAPKSLPCYDQQPDFATPISAEGTPATQAELADRKLSFQGVSELCPSSRARQS